MSDYLDLLHSFRKPFASELYAFGGAGKTYTALSSFRDHEKKEAIAEGRWILFGAEENATVEVPDANIRHFHTDKDKSKKWLQEFHQYMYGVHAAARQGKRPDVMVFDGLTEFSILWLQTHGVPGDLRATYGGLKDEISALWSLCNPAELGCHVIWTARVTERKKEVQNKRGEVIQEADPDYIDVDYYPSVEGKSAKFSSPHYFRLVPYMKSAIVKRQVGPKLLELPAHELHLYPQDGFFVKNDWQTEMIRRGHTGQLVNPTWEDVLRAITGKEKE